jgi:streptogramin lyase
MRHIRSLPILLLASLLMLWAVALAAQSSPKGKQFPIPTADSAPMGIAAGPDGALWFAESFGKIGRISTTGHIVESPVLPHRPYGIASSPDGGLWFTEYWGNKIGTISLS